MTDKDTSTPATSERRQQEVATTASPFESFRREMDRALDAFQRGEWRLPFGGALEREFPVLRGMGLSPALDLVEKDGAYELTVEVPGVEKDEIDVKLAAGRITIRGEKKEEKEEHEKDYHFSERRYGSFVRSLPLPPGIDEDAIEASHENGVLRIVLPKSEDAKKSERKIDIGKG